MDLLNPAALVLLALIPVLLLLRPRRHRSVIRRVPSLMLWSTGSGDGRPRPGRRRLRDPLLWLQVLAVAVLATALARPVLGFGAGRDVVFLFDASASMGALDASGPRFEQARKRALEILDRLPGRDRVEILVARSRPREVTSLLRNRRELRRRIVRLEPSEAVADLPAALLLALSTAGTDGIVYVFSDGAGLATVPSALRLERVRAVRVGGSAGNTAITRLATRPSRGSPFDHDLFAEVAHFAPDRRRVPLTIEADGRVLWTGELTLDPGERRRVAVEGAVPPGTVVRAALGAGDSLEADDHAYAVVPPRETIPVLLVSEGDQFVQRALEAHPSVALTVIPRRSWNGNLDRAGDRIVVFDGFEPEPPGPARAFVLRPPAASDVAAGRVLRRPELVVRAGAHPVLAGVDLEEVAVETASALPVPPGGRVLLEAAGKPVLVAWERSGRRRIVLGFDVQDSTWPLAVSFPVFIANALRWLAAGGDANPLQVAAGEVLEWSLPPPYLGLSEVTVEDPRGAVSTVAVTDGSFVFADTETTGVYSVRGDGFAAAFAVNLFNDRESDLSAATDLPYEGVAGSRRWGSGPPPRGREVGLQVILVALLVLLGEWFLYCRRSVA